jgi:hypothetical protein
MDSIKAGLDKPYERRTNLNYNSEIDAAKNARNNTLRDTDPRIEKEGFLGVDDLDRMRRRKIGKIF